MKKIIKGEDGFNMWHFLIIVILVYIILSFFNKQAVFLSLEFSLKIVKKVIPIFIFVFILMVLVNYYISPQLIQKYFSKSSGIKRWFIAIIGGIISTGPIYMWYPILKELKQKGVNYGFIATFLYNKAIKPFLLPIMIFYFGWLYTIIITIMMVIMSIIQGLIIGKIEEGGKL